MKEKKLPDFGYLDEFFDETDSDLLDLEELKDIDLEKYHEDFVEYNKDLTELVKKR